MRRQPRLPVFFAVASMAVLLFFPYFRVLVACTALWAVYIAGIAGALASSGGGMVRRETLRQPAVSAHETNPTGLGLVRTFYDQERESLPTMSINGHTLPIDASADEIAAAYEAGR